MYETPLKRVSLRIVEFSACGIGSAADVIGHTKDVRVRCPTVLRAKLRLGHVVVCGACDWDAAEDTIWGRAIITSPTRVRIAIRLCRRSCPRPIDARASVENVTELETLGESIGMGRLRVLANQVDS